MHERLEVSGQPLRRLHALSWIIIASISFASLSSPAESPGAVSEGSFTSSIQLPAALQEWSRIDSFPLSDALRHLKRGLESYFDARYAAALESLGDEQAVKATTLGDYLLFYRAKSHAMLEHNREALADFQRLERRYPDSPLLRDALVEQSRLLLSMNQAKSALAVLANPTIAINSETLYHRAKALDMTGEKEKAAEVFLQIYTRYPKSKQSPPAEKYLVSSTSGAFRGARRYEARLQRAESFIDSGDYRPARTLLLALAKVSSPSPALADRRNRLVGEVEYRLGRSSAAIQSLRKVTDANPAVHATALSLQGACLRRLDRIRDFLALRDRMLKLYPNSPDTEELCYSVATHFDVSYDAARSRDAYSMLYSAFPKGKYAERALWKLALSSFSEKKYDAAAAGFWNYLLAYPNPSSASPAMYWMGRCYERLGDTVSAKYLYQRSRLLTNEGYYGQKARESEMSLDKAPKKAQYPVPGIDFNRVITTCDQIQLATVELKEPEAAARLAISRARQLMAGGFPDLALAELRWGRDQNPGAEIAISYLIAKIYVSTRRHDAAIVTLRKAVPEYNSLSMASLPAEIWELLFPVRHWGIITQQSAKLDIDPNLVLGLIRQESAFDENARSKANARGLMQILPSTGRKLARQARIPLFSSKKLYQAETNIILGTGYFAERLRRYGKAELALAAYNAGDSRVERWLQEFGNQDMAEFVERIPFSETRGYVKQVLSNRAHYGILTSSPAAAIR